MVTPTAIPRSARGEVDDDGETLRVSIELSELDRWMRAAFEEGLKTQAEHQIYGRLRKLDPNQEWPQSTCGRNVDMLRTRIAQEQGIYPRPIDELMASDDPDEAIIL